MKDIVKGPEEFEYGEYYYIRRKYNIHESVGEYKWIWTLIDQDFLAVIDFTEQYGLKEYRVDSGIFSGLQIMDFERVQDEYWKILFDLRYKMDGVYLDLTTIETKTYHLKMTDPMIPVGSRFFGIKRLNPRFVLTEDFSEGTLNVLLPPNLNDFIEPDILCRHNYIVRNGKAYLEYAGALEMIYSLALPWDDEIYKDYIDYKIRVLRDVTGGIQTFES